MELLIPAVVLFAIGWAIYRSGKRTGSRKGFGAGVRKGRRKRY